MAKKYWWEEDEKQTDNQAEGQSNSQAVNKYWWDDGTIAKTIGNNVANRVNDWLSKHNTYTTDHQNRYSGRKGNYEDAYVSDSTDWLEKVKTQKSDFDSEYNSILSYMDQYKDYLDEGWVLDVKTNLLKAKSDQNRILNASIGDKMYWSNFESEDEYKEYAAQEKAHYDKWGHYKEEDDFDSTSANRTFVNPSDEDLAYYDAMMDYGSWRTDADGKMYDAFGNEIPYVADEKGNIIHPMQDDTRYAINDPLGMFLSTPTDARDEVVYGGAQTGKKFEVLREGVTNHWEQLNEDETSMYYYLMNTQGKDVAMEYLRDTAEKLNARWGNLKAQEISNIDNGFEKFVITGLFGLHAGVDQWGSGVAQLLSDEELPTSGMQYASSEIANSLDGLGGYAYQAATTVGNMLPSIFISRGLGMAGLGAGATGKNIIKGVGAFTMGSSAAGNAYGQALKEGYSEGQARTYGTLVGASEALLEYLIGGITDLGGIGTEKLLSKVSAIDKALIRIPAKFGIKIGSEIVEEELQNYLEPAFRSIIFGEDYDAPTFDEFVETAIVTALSTGFLEGGNTIAQDVAETQKYRDAGKTIMGAEGGVDALKNLANEVAGVSDAKMKKTLTNQAGKVSSEVATGKGLVGKAVAGVKNSSNATKAGRLYNTVNTANNLNNASANQADIAKSLQRKGFNAETANDISDALVAEWNGQELTKAQEKLLKSAKDSKVVQDAISNIMTNEQSTMGQRSQNVRSFERDISKGLISKALNEALMNSTTEKQFTPQGEYAVSKDGKATAMATEEVDGKTITKDTGEVININGIASIRKGEMLLDIGDGNTINSKNVAYANKNDALIYESIASLGDNINADTANKLIGKYKGGDALVFARGIAQAYTYGFYGIDRSELTGKRSLTTELTEDQRNFAYGLGEQYRPIKDANDKTKSIKKLAKSGKTPSEKGVYYRDKDGNATDISTYLKDSNIKLNDLQKTGIEAMRKMSKMMGARFNVFESWVENGKSYYLNEDGKVVEGNPNGFYDTTTGEIYIDLNAGNDFQGTMLFTIAHEVTHFMRQWSPEHFTKIAKIVFQHGGMKGNVSELVALKQAKAKAKGKPISYDVAMEEVVADGMETILKDGKVVEFMADVKKQDYAAWEKLKGWFKNLAKFLRKMVWAYSGQSAQTVEGAKVAEFSQDILDQIERVFAEGAVASGENYSRVESIVGQINIFLDEIIALDTVATIDSSNATPYTGIRKIDEISGRDAFKAQGGLAIRPGFGRVHIGKKGAVNTVFHGNGPAKQAAFPAIKAVIENGIEIARDYNHDGLGFDTITFSAPIKFYGKKAPLAVVVKVFESVNADKTFYIHEICDAQGNYIQMDGTEFEQKNSSTNLVEPTSTVSAADDGNNPNINIHNDSEIVKSESAEAIDLEVDAKTESVAPSTMNSERTWTESDYVQEREKAAKEISKAIGVSVKKAKAYIDSVNSIAKMIAEDRVRLDYFSSPGRSSFVGNVEYGGSFDFSTLCKKRRLLTGTFTAIQKALPNTALTADEILKIRNRMKDAGLEVSCGLCYVEGSRANMGQFAKEFLKLYKQYYPDAWQPNMADVNTPDGIEWVRINHPECYEQYEYFWNHYGTLKPGDKNLFASQQKPKLYQLHTEYKGEVLEKFNNDDNVEAKNLNGGIRLQSFSDFEIVHLIDTMQIIMDMSRVGLAGQAYTKVPDFAWALGDTGLKINLSLIAKGVDENGKLIFDDVEGMPIADAMKLRDRYSKNVGTILVAFNDEQLLAAMADDRVDYIIPFHRSQWKKSQYGAMGLPAKTKDYTYMQNEKFIKPQYHEYRGRMVQDKATNYMPNEYWDFSKSGKENAEAYLEMCARNNKRPKFYKLLQNNGDGSYSLKADGSTDGYWKLLIDFKMYDNDGNGSPQMPVKPEFNMDEAQRMLNDYQGGHSNFPVAQGVVDSFVEEYKESHKGALYSDRDDAPTFYSQMAKVVDAVKQEKLGASSVVSMLRGKGVKAEEIKWSGIEAWLEGKKSVTKAELQEFIAGSMLQIGEQMSGINRKAYEELEDLWAEHIGGSVYDELEEITADDLADLLDDMETDGRTVPPYDIQSKMIDLAREMDSGARWGEYKLDGGRNYREIVFKMPGASYTNRAMRVHWGEDAYGIIAHSRVQDFEVDGNKMLFIEEIQSDWHNEGHSKGYESAEYKEAERVSDELFNKWQKIRQAMNKYARSDEFTTDPEDVRKKKWDWYRMREEEAYKKRQEADARLETLMKEGNGTVPDAPFRDNYHEFVLKRLLRMAAEEGYDSIGWTTADVQMDRWNPKRRTNAEMGIADAKNPDAVAFEEGYSIEYDQDIPKFLRKYGKKWGAEVGKTTLKNSLGKEDYTDDHGFAYSSIKEWYDAVMDAYDEIDKDIWNRYIRGLTKVIQVDNTMHIQMKDTGEILDASLHITKDPVQVWSMDITPAMKESVMTEGQPLYSDRVLMGSLFSGGGTLEAGLAYQMLDKQFGVEYDGKIASVYADNHGDHIQVGRVEDFDISKYDDIFYLHASPVCHNFSNAKHGAKELQMDINSAKATAKHLETAMPQVFTVENAPGYRKSQSLKIITDKLTELGYKWDVDVYNSADYGSATSRNRVILRAVKDGELPAKPTKQERTNSWDKATRDLWDTLPKATLRPSFISAIENTRNLPILDANGKVNVNKPLLILTTTSGHTVTYCWEGDICPTLTTKCGEARLVMPDGNIYAVTPEFMGRIQGLPDDYKYPKEKTRAFTIIGNGIPTHLTKAVVGGVLDSAYEQTHDGDVLYQDRADESVSNRSLLANAFEGLAQNDIEKNKIQEYKGKIDLINSEEKKLSELNQQIKELSFSKGPRDTKKIKGLRFDAAQAANRINTYDKQLLRLEASKPLQDVLAREKRRAYKKAEERGKEALAEYKTRVEAKQKETAEKWRESRKTAVAKARETAEKREAREKLQKLVLDTAKWISYPAKTDVKCPDILKQPYADFLNGIDLSSKRVANGGDPTKNDLRLANAMGSLATALDRIMTSQDPTQDSDKVLDTGYLDLPADFVQKLRDMTENIKSMMVEGDYVVNNMTAAEVRQLSQMIRTLNHAIKTMSKLYANLRFANIEALGVDTMDFMDALGEIEKTGNMKDFVQWDNALPYYAFKRFGKGGESVFEGLMDAQDKLAFLAKEIFAFQEKTWTGKEAKAWSEDTHTITLPNGNELTLTTADAMSIYCLSRREQGLQHLLGGGTRVMGLQKGSQKAKDSRSMLTIEDVSAIISSLTDRQKQVAEGIQEFMSTVCSEWGNEISMKRFLTRDFSEKFYFPIESNDENLPTKDPAAQQSDLFRLLNISATKPLTPGANNEVIIRNVFDVFTGHTSDMARLNAYGMALLDYMKWLNYREKTVTDEGQVNVKGVRKSMEKAYGNAAKSYVLNLVKDVNGRPSDNGDPNILMKWMRAAKTASVGNSLRVATLQITSYPRAALVLSPKSLTLGLSKLPQIEKAKKYCGIALWKSFGFYDTNISRSIEDQMKGVTDVKQKLIELSLKGAEWGDAITWGALWNACEYEVAKTTKNKVGAEEFYQEVGNKLREVVYRTQVVDSTLTRSQIMRSKRGMAQEAAAFMSEPTLSANILMDAGFEFNAEKRRTGSAKAAWKKTGSYIGRTVAVYAICQLTAALLEGLWDAWRDEEDEEFKEKYIDAFVENLVLDLAPFNKIPIVSDVFEAALAMFNMGFYSSDKMSTTWLTQAVSAVDAWKDVLSGESSATVYNALYKSTRSISSFIGVSISGLMREAVALWNNTAGAYDPTLKILTYDRSKGEKGDMLLDAMIKGDARLVESLEAEFADEDAYSYAVRTAIKDRYDAGEIDSNTAEQYLVKFGGLEDDDAYWKVQEWEYEMETGEDFKKYNDFYTAVQTGKDLKAVIKSYTDNGVEAKTLASQITSHFKPLYKEMSNTERAAIKGYLLNAYQLLGYNRSEKSKDIDKWLKD